MAGRHEPPSKRSFWFSLTTSVMKWLVVVAAVVVGVFFLARAFDSTVSSTVAPVAVSPAAVASSGAEKPPKQSEPTSDFSGTLVALCNGTTTRGLATKAVKPLEAAGYTIDELCNTTQDVATTTVYWVKSKDQAAAEAVAQDEFPDADVLEYPKGTAVVDAASGATAPPTKGIQVVVFLGADYSK